ncbi:MAG: hypothetical protein ISS48_04195 [Candidatus Aenigmarchaeota archaeon]|nr:hypothetical protein [Candidatus Aenigmarchaeota archaeon]
MNVNKKITIAIMLITGFIFAVSFATLYVQTHIVEGTVCSCTLPIPLLIPTFSSLGVFVGSLVYYLMFARIKETEKKSTQEARALLDMLQNDEREIIKKIVENKGEITQSKLSRSLGKVKAFRTLEILRKRGIIVKEKYGKTNMIRLNDNFREILC